MKSKRIMNKYYSYFLFLIMLTLVLTGCGLLGGNNNTNTHQHSFSNEWVSNTQYHWQACSGCDEVRYKEEHEWDTGTIITEPTSETDGSKLYTCQTCGRTKTEVVPKLGHVHVFDQQVVDDKYLAKGADCTNSAKYYYSCSCGEKGSTTFDFGEALGHSFTNYVSNNNATCSADGTKTAKCDRCNETNTIVDEGSKTPHTFSKDWTFDNDYHWHAATCEHTSEIDGKALHSYDNGLIVTEPSETAEGLCRYTCTICGKTKEEVIPRMQLFTVTFVDDDGSTLKTERVESGKAATPPEIGDKDGYKFEGWSSPFQIITGDITITAIYKAIYEVEFKDYNNALIDHQDVIEGENATVPSNPSREGYRFIEWKDVDNNTITDFTNIDNNLTVYATYVREYSINFFNEKNVKIGNTQYVVPSLGETVSFPTVIEKEGYDIVWSDNLENITSDLDVYLSYVIKKYSVKFLSYDGTVLKEQTVTHGLSATAPDNYEEYYLTWGRNYVSVKSFDSWDKDYSSITEDTIVTTVYKDGYNKPIIAIDTSEEPYKLFVCLPSDYTIYSLKIDFSYKRVLDRIVGLSDSQLYTESNELVSIEVNTREKHVSYMWVSPVQLENGCTYLFNIYFKEDSFVGDSKTVLTFTDENEFVIIGSDGQVIRESAIIEFK